MILSITYTTFFDVTELDANDPALDHYRNTAAIDWTDEAGNNHHSEDSKPFKPLPAFDLNAQKAVFTMPSPKKSLGRLRLI